MPIPSLRCKAFPPLKSAFPEYAVTNEVLQSKENRGKTISMTPEELHEDISKLRLNLKELTEVDETTREELSRLEKRIENLLDDGNEEETVPEQVIAHIEEAATSFAVKHPTAESLLRRIAYALGRMGI